MRSCVIIKGKGAASILDLGFHRGVNTISRIFDRDFKAKTSP